MTLDLRDAERETAITGLFEAQYGALLRLAVLLGAGSDAEDVVSEAFCELHRRWYGLRDAQAGLAYLRRVVCNQSRMRIRHQQVVRRHDGAVRPDPAALAASAESEVVLREDQRHVVTALAALPDRQRQALVLRYWLDLKESEVAEAMGVSCGTVKVHTFRGMATLTRLLEERMAEGRILEGWR
ncbi:MAG: RNA polymerase sigma factor [Actinomycetes bacterium]